MQTKTESVLPAAVSAVQEDLEGPAEQLENIAAHLKRLSEVAGWDRGVATTCRGTVAVLLARAVELRTEAKDFGGRMAPSDREPTTTEGVLPMRAKEAL